MIEVLSSHVGGEFTRKKDAYLDSARLIDYYVIDSTRRYVAHYFWGSAEGARRRLYTAEYRRGPVPMPSQGIALDFSEVYAGTDVPAIIHPIASDDHEPSEVHLD